jgi:hypothetical protein
MILPRKALFVVACGLVGALAIAILVYSARSIETPSVQVRVKRPEKPASLNAPTDSGQNIDTRRSARANRDWGREYGETTNYFGFVSKAAKAALDGDARAALYVSKALYLCLPIKMYANSTNPPSDFGAYSAAHSHAPQWVLDKARKDFQSCAGFINNDAFADLPERPGGYNSIAYWTDKAANDPVAQALQAGAAIANTNFEKSSDVNAKSLDSAQQSINGAIASRDPTALFQVGQLLSDGHASSDPLQGFALSIAACNLGYDCSANNDELFHGCAARGQCPPGMSYADIVRKAIGDEGYAQAYARAQQIQDAMARDDTNALQQFVQLKR